MASLASSCLNESCAESNTHASRIRSFGFLLVVGTKGLVVEGRRRNVGIASREKMLIKGLLQGS